jgi:hypothetical protein
MQLQNFRKFAAYLNAIAKFQKVIKSPKVLFGKQLYGFKESGRNFRVFMDNVLQSKGKLNRSAQKPCIYFDTDDPSSPMFVLVYVDDIIIMAKDVEKTKETKRNY